MTDGMRLEQLLALKPLRGAVVRKPWLSITLMVMTCLVMGESIARDEPPSTLERNAKAVGRDVGAAARKVGQEAKKVGKAVGQTAKKGAKAVKEGGKEFARAVKGESSQDSKSN